MRAYRNPVTSPAPMLIALSAAILVIFSFAYFFVARARTAPGTGPVTVSAAQDAAGSALSSQIAVEGWVTEAGSRRPIAGAVVTIGTLDATSDERGYFSFATADIERVASHQTDGYSLLNVDARADGYAAWRLELARYFPADTLRVYPRLSSTETMQVAAAGRLQLGAPGPEVPDLSGAIRPSASGDSSMAALGLGAALTPPDSIRVYRTASGVVEVVPFKEYVKHVLPNEWVPTWAPHALRAGAMAVKEYAWYWVARGGKQVALGADVKDNTDDQVYDPNVSYASTDAAVDATWQYAMTRNGLLFQAQYCAGSYGPDPAGDCPWGDVAYMTQWGTAYYADHARSWAWIVKFY